MQSGLPREIVVVFFFLVFAPLRAQNPSEAIALQQAGRLPEAEQAWRQVVQQNPRDAEALASLGVVLSRQEKYGEAASAYRKALALKPKLPGIQLNLGLAEFKQGRFPAALAPLAAALKTEPQSMQARTLLGMSYYGAKRFADASKHLEVAAKADPANTELQHLLAQSCLWAKKYTCAVEGFRKILQQNPDSAPAHMLTGQALDGLGKTPEAIAEFHAAAQVAPREPNVNFGLGYLYWKQHQYDEAKVWFERELAVDPKHAQSLAYLADIELKRDSPDTALPLLEKAVAANKDLRIAYVNLGAALMQKKQYEEAMKALRRAITLDPLQPDAHFRLGRLYQAMGNKAAAQKEFAKVRELQQQKVEEDIVHTMSAAPPPLPGTK
jgi:tetratricopeptide (TPR) repeat protein